MVSLGWVVPSWVEWVGALVNGRNPPRAVDSTGLTSGPCLDFDLSPLSLPEEAVASIAADTMLMVPGDQDGLEHVITLTVQKVSFVGGVGDVRNSTAAISLYVVPGDPPEVFIDALKLPKAVSLPRPPVAGCAASD